MSFLNVVVVGCGGIGGCLLPVLGRYLNYQYGGNVSLTLIDGDTFEKRNSDRQSFKSEINKADELLDVLANDFPNIKLRSQPIYINKSNVKKLIKSDTIIFSCVDNHATRLLLSDHCCELDNVLHISGGNDYTTGNIQVHLRVQGNNLTLPVANDFYPEILHPTDKIPTNTKIKAGCEAEAVSEPQLLIANNAIATAMLNFFYGFTTTNKLHYYEVEVDVFTNQVRTKKTIEVWHNDRYVYAAEGTSVTAIRKTFGSELGLSKSSYATIDTVVAADESRGVPLGSVVKFLEKRRSK